MKPMIIVVEGMDNTGKTTLAMKIAKAMRAVYVKAERPAVGPDLLVYQNILETATQYTGICVADRHVAISEPIYGTICRGGHQLDEKDIESCIKRLGLIVYCRPPDRTIHRTIDLRPQMEGVVANTDRLITAYDEFFFDMQDQISYTQYNFETRPDSEIVEYCRRIHHDHFKGAKA